MCIRDSLLPDLDQAFIVGEKPVIGRGHQGPAEEVHHRLRESLGEGVHHLELLAHLEVELARNVPLCELEVHLRRIDLESLAVGGVIRSPALGARGLEDYLVVLCQENERYRHTATLLRGRDAVSYTHLRAPETRHDL